MSDSPIVEKYVERFVEAAIKYRDNEHLFTEQCGWILIDLEEECEDER